MLAERPINAARLGYGGSRRARELAIQCDPGRRTNLLAGLKQAFGTLSETHAVETDGPVAGLALRVPAWHSTIDMARAAAREGTGRRNRLARGSTRNE